MRDGAEEASAVLCGTCCAYVYFFLLTVHNVLLVFETISRRRRPYGNVIPARTIRVPRSIRVLLIIFAGVATSCCGRISSTIVQSGVRLFTVESNLLRCRYGNTGARS